MVLTAILVVANGLSQSVGIGLENATTDPRFEVRSLPASQLAALRSLDLTHDVWQKVFAVFVVADYSSPTSDIPPVGGSYRIEDDSLVFMPHFPLGPGLRYRVVFSPIEPGSPVTAIFEVPKTESVASTVVDHVYPSTDLLPANQLKLYLHFSAPMSRGEAYQRIHLVDEQGHEIELPFLELDEELWDREGQRLTILFDPGRIKRGLLPHEEVGPAIEPGKQYALVIDRAWVDATGNSLREGFRKSFRVGPSDREPPDPKSWQLSAPAAGTRAPLALEFPEPIDYALLFRLLEVTDQFGNSIDGLIEVDQQETRWRFIPEQPWKTNDYFLIVETILEDLAGNTIGRLFEVDIFERVQERVDHDGIWIPFQVKE